MKSLGLAFVFAAFVFATGCNKPTESDCRKALSNMQHLMGTENLRDPAYLEGEVRRCKGGSKKKAVQCAIKAQTLDELRTCDFYKVPANAPGVGTPDTGPGSAATGSATPSATGSDTGSAAGSAMAAGSDTGSAATGSAAAGSAAAGSAAAGSAAGSGSAAATATGSGAAAGSAK